MTYPPETPQVPQQPAPVSPPPQYAPGPYPPPQQYAPYPPPYYPVPPAKPQRFWSTPGGIILIVVGGVIALCLGFGVIGAVGRIVGASDMKADITSCEFSGGMLPAATVGYTVTNSGDSTRSVRIKFEYRDSSGSRIDTDSAYVRDVAPGDTVRGEETTILNATVSSGKCAIVGVS